MTSWCTATASIALILCELIIWRRQSSSDESDEDGARLHHRISRTIHVLERLINAFSDQQSIAGLSLLVVAGHGGCEISAYIYNLICFLILMSLITHLNALTNTRNWFGGEESQTIGRGIFDGIVKILPIAATIVLAGIMLGARIGTNFPVYAGQLATLPAACFENSNPYKGAQTFTDAIGKHKTDWANKGFIQYMILMIDLCVVGGILMLALIKKIKKRPAGFRAGLSLALRTLSTTATTGTLVWLSVEYISMRRDMEGDPKLYQPDPSSNQYSYYNVVTWALFASSMFTIISAFAEAYNGSPHAMKEVSGQVEIVQERFAKMDPNYSALSNAEV